MKKRIVAAVLAALLLLSLAACASGGANTSADSGEAAAEIAWATEKGDMAADVPREPDAPERADFSAVRQNSKLILRADYDVETQTFDETCAAVETLTAEAGGYIEASNASGRAGSRSAYYTLRVPQEKFETFLQQMGDTCHVVRKSRSSEDVTEAYTDIETRWTTLQTKHERLLRLLDQAATMEDIISLENALADCEYEIDSLTGAKRKYDSLVDFSSVELHIDETTTLSSVPEGTGFVAELRDGAQFGLNGVLSFVRGVVLTIVMFWPLWVIAVIVWLIVRRIVRRRRAKRAQRMQTVQPIAPVDPTEPTDPTDPPVQL